MHVRYVCSGADPLPTGVIFLLRTRELYHMHIACHYRANNSVDPLPFYLVNMNTEYMSSIDLVTCCMFIAFMFLKTHYQL